MKSKFASKKDVEDAVDELAQITDKNFRRVDRNFRRIEGKMVTKKDLQQAEERIVKRVVHEMQVAREQEIAELEAAHKDELVSVEDKSKAPTPWQSVPRRVTALEMDMEKVKDHLEIS